MLIAVPLLAPMLVRFSVEPAAYPVRPILDAVAHGVGTST